jgi:signal transduction histidine kinase
MANGSATMPATIKSRSNIKVLIFCALLAAGIFVLDIASLPLGVAAGVAYVAVILVSLWLPKWQHSLLVAGAASVLTVLGYLWSEPAAIQWMVVANRLLALAAIWLTAIVGGWLVFSKSRSTEEALTHAEEEAERARNAKSRFLESTSNDMRQHLQTLSLLGAVMRKSVAEPKVQEICAAQNDAVAHLGDLLNSILEFCELESGAIKPTLARTSIDDIFDRLGDEFLPQAKTKGLHLSFSSTGQEAYSDRILLMQVLRSLLSNAIRYTNEGTVKITGICISNDVRVSVEDTGIGIAPDKLSIIFDEFYRVDSDPVSRSGGRGLGLSIVDRGLHLLQTNVEVESVLGKGSKFSFIVPVAEQDSTG